ncbi:MAG: PilT/PilU family type 4a pilus ATPase [Planctomycetota bacterium]|nr:PilT/PilU family type 4a pilus ATPase [Planctomycetota bacterium]
MNSKPASLALDLATCLRTTVESGASDLHVVSGSKPVARKHGQLVELEFDVLGKSDTERLLMEVCPSEYHDRFASERNLDFALEIQPGDGNPGAPLRYRANYFYAGDQVGACFRVIPNRIPDFSWANFPHELAQKLGKFRNGIILFSGVAGSGKTTSLAMLIDSFISMGGKRIITIEEPIEYLFESRTVGNRTSVITQREVGKDVISFADGLKYGLRQDPDIILVGEIRDRETAQIALSAAETGHLVLSTLHTRDAKGAISRFTDLFESNMQAEVRAQLALSLRAVISQHLLPSSVDGSKRELALEVLINNLPVASGIRMGKLETLDNNIQTGGKDGMISLDDSIKRLMIDGMITEETAASYVSDAAYLWR